MTKLPALEAMELGNKITNLINEFEDSNPGMTVGQLQLEHTEKTFDDLGFVTKSVKGVSVAAAVVVIPLPPKEGEVPQ